MYLMILSIPGLNFMFGSIGSFVKATYKNAKKLGKQNVTVLSPCIGNLFKHSTIII